MVNSNNVVWHQATVTRERRERLNGHRSVNLWFTGLSGAGKSTVAHALEEALHQRGCRTFVFDGDNVRHGLCADLGFSEEDRRENIRRIGEMVKLFLEGGVIALTAFISPFRADRRRVRELLGEGDFVEVYCRCGLGVITSYSIHYTKLYDRQIRHCYREVWPQVAIKLSQCLHYGIIDRYPYRPPPV